MRVAPIIIGVISVPIYFFTPLALLIWHFRTDDTLAWVWVFGGWALLFPFFMLCCSAGFLTCAFFFWCIEYIAKGLKEARDGSALP